MATESDGENFLLNGAALRVLGGILFGVGISPLVVRAFTYPLELAFGPAAIPIFAGGVYLLSAVFGLVVLHLVRLFYRGTWRSLENEEWQARRQ